MFFEYDLNEDGVPCHAPEKFNSHTCCIWCKGKFVPGEVIVYDYNGDVHHLDCVVEEVTSLPADKLVKLLCREGLQLGRLEKETAV